MKKNKTIRVTGQIIRDEMDLDFGSIRDTSPDQTASNRWGAVFDLTEVVRLLKNRSGKSG